LARKTDIRLRRSNTAGAVPSGSNLNEGELAINTADGALYFRKSDSTIITAHDNTIMHIDSTNNRVGIGTTSPDKTLDVLGDIRSINGSQQHQLRASQIISYGVDAILNAQSAGDDVLLRTQSTTRLIATAEGNIGIGIDIPTEKLHVVGDVSIGTGGTGGTASLKFVNDNERSRITSNYDAGGGGRLGFWTDTTGGTLLQRLTISNSGNVGIGDTAPDFKLAIRTPAIPSGSTYAWPLDLSRPNTASRGLSFGVGASGGPHAIGAHNGDIGIGQTFGTDSNGLPQFYETLSIVHDGTASGGNVGIATSTPTDKLDVAGALRLTANISFDANKAGRIYKASNHGLAFHGVAGTENDFALFTSSGQLMVVNPTGTNNVLLVPTAPNAKVGIGTTAPAGNLHIKSTGNIGDAKLIIEADADNNVESDNPRIELRQDNNLVSGSLYLEGGAGTTATNTIDNALVLDSKGALSNQAIQFATGGRAAAQSGGESNSNVAMTILGSGSRNVGIGTTTPSAALHIASTTANATGIGFQNSSRYYAIEVEGGGLRVKDVSAGLVERFRIASNGRVGIGTIDPDGLLHVQHTSVNSPIIVANRYNDTSTGTDFRPIFAVSEADPFSTGTTATIIGNHNRTMHLGSLYGADGTASATSNCLTLLSSGLVGIGTSSPQHEIDLTKTLTTINQNPTVQVKNAWTTEGNNTGFDNKAIGLFSAGADTVITKIQARYDSGANVGQIGTQTAHDFLFTTSNAERMRITSSGSVNIGNATNFSTADGDDLQVGNTSGSHGITIVGQNTATANLFFGDNNYNDAGAIRYNHTHDRMEFYTARTQRMSISSTGAVTFNQAFTFPTAIGSAGQILKVPTTGTDLVWGADAGGGSASLLTDADGDTLIQVEESADEDTIRFDCAGSQIAQINSNGISIVGDITGSQHFKASGNNMSLHAGGNQIINIDLNGKFYPQTHNAVDLGFSDSQAFRNLRLVGAMTGGASIAAGNITTTGYLRGPASFVIDPAAHGDDTGTVVIAGNLQVDGTTTTINSTTLTVDDKNITLASGSANAAAANGAGITVAGASANIVYQSTNDRWTLNKEVFAQNGFMIGSTATDVGLIKNSSGVFDFQAQSAREISFSNVTNGEHVRIDATGNVGIGTDNPLAPLDVVRGGTTGLSSVNARTALLVQNNLSNGTVISINAKNTGYSGIFFGDQNAEAVCQIQYDHTDDKLKFLTNGGGYNPLTLSGQNVGIGTTAPAAKLHVKKASAGTTHFDSYATAVIEDTEARLQIISDDGGNNASSILLSNETKHWGINHKGPSSSNRFSIGYVATTSSGTDIVDTFSEKFNITPAGNVGIGTTSPGYKLHVKETGTNTGAIYVEDGTSWLRVVPNLGGSGFNPMSAAGDIGLIFSNDNDNSTNSTTNGLLIAPHSTSASGIKILEDGRVGIATTTPNSRFTVNVGSQGDGIELQSNETSIAKLSRTTVGSTVVASLDGVAGRPINIGGIINEDVLLANAGGNVGIGTSSPDTKLDVTSSGVNGILLNQDTASAAASSRLMFKDNVRTNLLINVNGILQFRTDAAVNSSSGTTRLSVSPTLVKSEVPLRVEEYQIDTTVTSTSATTQVAINTFAAATFRSARFTVQITNTTDSTYHSTEILAIHDGTTANITEFGEVHTGSSVEATFDADISSGNFRLLATPTSTNSMAFKVVCHSLTV